MAIASVNSVTPAFLADLNANFAAILARSDTVYASDYGVVPDGGISDQAANLQSAMSAAAASGAALAMPAGRIKVGSTINGAAACAFVGPLGWEKTIIMPASDSIGTLFNLTGEAFAMSSIEVDASGIVSPTFSAVKINASGFVQLDNLYIYGAGIGVYVIGANACRSSNLRIQNCPVGVQTGGTNGSFPGDLTWLDIVVIPTTAGIGWIVDGNSNAQYMEHVLIAGGATCLDIRGSGASTNIPDGILQNFCNYTASSGPVVKIEKGRNIQFMGGTVIGGSTGDDGLLINAATVSDIDGVILNGAQVRANYKRGINFAKGANLQITGGQVYGNSDGGGSGTYSNVLVGAAACGLFQMTGTMAGLSASGEIFANVQAPAKYGVELASGALTDVTNYPGRVLIVGNVFDGNTTGDISDGSAPTGHRKVIANNMLAS